MHHRWWKSALIGGLERERDKQKKMGCSIGMEEWSVHETNIRKILKVNETNHMAKKSM